MNTFVKEIVIPAIIGIAAGAVGIGVSMALQPAHAAEPSNTVVPIPVSCLPDSAVLAALAKLGYDETAERTPVLLGGDGTVWFTLRKPGKGVMLFFSVPEARVTCLVSAGPDHNA